MTDAPLLQTPGEMLAAARERAGLSLDQVAERTKIPPGMLEAIERDEYHKISGQLYVRSFLRSYAVDVGLDPEQVLELHGRFGGGDGAADGDRAQVWAEEEVVIQRVGIPWRKLVIIAVVVVAVLAGAIFIILGFRGGEDTVQENAPQGPLVQEVQTQESPPQDTQADDGPAQASEELPPPEETASGGQGDDHSGAAETGARQGADPVESLDSQVEIPAVAAESQVPGADLRSAFSGDRDVAFAGTAQPPLVLRVMSANPVKIEVRADGQRSYALADWPDAGVPALPAEGVVAGQVYRSTEGFVVYWGAADHFSLRLGATEGVQVHLDGSRYPLAGLAPGQEVIVDRHSVGR